MFKFLQPRLLDGGKACLVEEKVMEIDISNDSVNQCKLQIQDLRKTCTGAVFWKPFIPLSL